MLRLLESLQQLNVTPADVEDLLMSLILDGKVAGKIDQVNQRLELDRSNNLNNRRYAALERWTTEMVRLQGVVASKHGELFWWRHRQ